MSRRRGGREAIPSGLVALGIAGLGWLPQIWVWIAVRTAGAPAAESPEPAWPMPLVLAGVALLASVAGLVFTCTGLRTERYRQGGILPLLALCVQAFLGIMACDLVAESYGPGKILLACRLFQLAALFAAAGVVVGFARPAGGGAAPRRRERMRRITGAVVVFLLVVIGGYATARELTHTELHECRVDGKRLEEHRSFSRSGGHYDVRVVTTTCGAFVVRKDRITGEFWDTQVWSALTAGREYDLTVSGFGPGRLNVVALRESGVPD